GRMLVEQTEKEVERIPKTGIGAVGGMNERGFPLHRRRDVKWVAQSRAKRAKRAMDAVEAAARKVVESFTGKPRPTPDQVRAAGVKLRGLNRLWARYMQKLSAVTLLDHRLRDINTRRLRHFPVLTRKLIPDDDTTWSGYLWEYTAGPVVWTLEPRRTRRRFQGIPYKRYNNWVGDHLSRPWQPPEEPVWDKLKTDDARAGFWRAVHAAGGIQFGFRPQNRHNLFLHAFRDRLTGVPMFAVGDPSHENFEVKTVAEFVAYAKMYGVRVAPAHLPPAPGTSEILVGNEPS